MRSRGTAFSSAGCTRAPPGPAGTDAAPTETAAGTASAGAAAGAGAAGLALPASNAARISFLLMRPPAPLPAMPARSTWCSFARRRTKGELRTSLPLPRPAGAALGGCARRCSNRVDHGDHGLDRHGLPFRDLDFLQHAGRRGRDLRVHFVGGDFEQRLIALDAVARFLEPLGNRAFKNTFAHLGHDHVDGHGAPLSVLLSVPDD